MLNKILIICSLTFTTFAGLQANEEISPQVGSAIENKRPARTCNKCPKKGKKNGKKKDLSPGALVCNGSEDRCVKEKDNEETTTSSSLFTVFSDDQQDEENLIACKDCQ